MRKSSILTILILSAILIISTFYLKSAFAAVPVLNKSTVNLHIEQDYKLKIKGLGKNSIVKWSVKNVKVASITANGKVRGHSKGKTEVYAKIYNKNKLKYTLKSTVKVDNKGYVTNQASLTKLLKNVKVEDIIINR